MEKNVTLQEMLCFREEKVKLQDQLRKKYEGTVIVALGMNIPGPRKTSPVILKAFTEGEEALKKTFVSEGLGVREEITVKEKEGCLKLCAVECTDPLFVKKITVRLEETHPLGRLFDIDVYDAVGRGMNREELGAPVRRCLICEKAAKICGRNRSHTVQELYDRVEEIIDLWQKGEGR